MGKRHKRDLNMYMLPEPAIEKVVAYGCRSGIVCMSSLNREHRREFGAFVFKHIKATWYTLQDEEFQRFLKAHKWWVEQIRVVDSYSYGEWQIDVFSQLFTHLPNLRRLVVNSFNSSNWLKYRNNNTITSITMFYDDMHNETESLHQNPNPKNIRRLYKPNNLPKIFNLHHLNGFPFLVRLSLDNYHFNWDESMASLKLQFIKLVDCTWEYPFTPVKFNENNSVLEFELEYNDDNPFLLSERYMRFLKEPSQTDCNIGKLAIRLFNCERMCYLSLRKLKPFLDSVTFPRLKQLDLTGWKTDQHSLLALFKLIGSVHIDVLIVNSSHHGSLQYNQFPNVLVKSN